MADAGGRVGPATHGPPAHIVPPGGPAALIEAVGITKRFGALVANDDIALSVLPGEVHALLGENGAGKSTLTKILYGLSQPDAGELRVDGRAVYLRSPKDAMRAGVGMVTQEFSLVGPMTVTENVMLTRVGYGPVDRRSAGDAVAAAAARLGVDVRPDAIVEQLSVGERQRVEIVKALFNDCRVLILDEPTAVLVPQDVARLFVSIRRLTATGMGVLFISHKLHEVMEIADRVTVLRRGRLVVTRPAAGLDPDAIAALMMGAAADTAAAAVITGEVGNEPPREAVVGEAAAEPSAMPASAAIAALSIRDLTLAGEGAPRLDGVSIEVPAGEIVGVAGVSGNGQTELVDVLCASVHPTRGTIAIAGHDVTALDAVGRMRAGLGRITEDRRGSVVPSLSVEQNLVLEDLERFSRWGVTRRRTVREHTRRLIEQFDIRAAPHDAMRTLSGGNTQKVLLARALSRQPVALVVAQPTRGLDVGACNYVYDQLRAVRDRGGGVLLVSEDIDELLAARRPHRRALLRTRRRRPRRLRARRPSGSGR